MSIRIDLINNEMKELKKIKKEIKKEERRETAKKVGRVAGDIGRIIGSATTLGLSEVAIASVNLVKLEKELRKDIEA